MWQSSCTCYLSSTLGLFGMFRVSESSLWWANPPSEGWWRRYMISSWLVKKARVKTISPTRPCQDGWCLHKKNFWVVILSPYEPWWVTMYWPWTCINLCSSHQVSYLLSYLHWNHLHSIPTYDMDSLMHLSRHLKTWKDWEGYPSCVHK
jgi:hypothetical protein